MKDTVEEKVEFVVIHGLPTEESTVAPLQSLQSQRFINEKILNQFKEKRRRNENRNF